MSNLPLALVVHDLKNALGGLEGQLLAMSEAPTPQAAQEALANCTELRQRFVQFLTVYSSEHGLTAQCEDESPADLVTRLARDAAHGLFTGIHKALSIQTCTEQAPPYWYYDRRLVRMALEAALHNAERFANQSVMLGARSQDQQLVFYIDDDGPGLGGNDSSELSTGLGTHLCQAIAKAHSVQGRTGKVMLLNRPEGGARFELWLP